MVKMIKGRSNLANQPKPYAIVIGLDCMQGLQTARILAGQQVPVIAIANKPNYYSCKTKVCEKIMFVNTEKEELIELLESLGPTFTAKAVLFPCQDKNVLTISRYRHRLKQWFHIILPSPEVVEMMIDKVRFYQHAQENELPIPLTFILYSREDAKNAATQLTYPCTLKPPYRLHAWSKHTKAKAFKVTNAEELLEMYDHYSQWMDILIAQDWIEGTDADLYSCNCYFTKRSELVATFVARKLRQWPPQTGQSCLGEECRNDVVLNETIRLFRSVNYCGLGYLEMKYDRRNDKYFIIEPNIGRPTGRSAIAEAGGVELHYAMYCDAVNLPLPLNLEQKYQGVKWIHVLRDIQSSLHYWRKGELTIKEWRESVHGDKAYAVFSWRDPVPFIAAIFQAIRLQLSPNKRSETR